MRLRRLSCLLLASLLFICVVYSALPYGLVRAADSEVDIIISAISDVWVSSDDWPYAVLAKVNSRGIYRLYLCDQRPYFDLQYNVVTTLPSSLKSFLVYDYDSDLSSFVEQSPNSSVIYLSPDSFPLFWSFVNVYDTNNNLYFAGQYADLPDPNPPVASDPVFTQNLPEGTGTVPYTVNYTVGQAAEPLTVAAESTDGGTITYQWYQYGEDTSPIIPNATDASFTPPTDTAGETTYYCQATNTISSGSIKTLNSNHVKVVVSAAPVPTPDPDDPDTAIKDGIDNISDQLTELPSAIGDRVDQAADSLGNKILDGIKGLFVPDEEDIADIKDKWEQLLSERFGAVYESATIIDSIVDAFVYNGDMETISFPSVTVDLAGTPFTFGGWEVEVVPDRFRFLTTTSKLITSIVCTVLFVNGMKKKLEGLLAA